MHVLAVIEDTVRIPFYQLDKSFKSTLIEKINKQYSNFVSSFFYLNLYYAS